MSVYSFGKITTDTDLDDIRNRMHELAKNCHVTLSFGLQDPEDDNLFRESLRLQARGVVFNLFSPGNSDVGTIWQEAFDAGQRSILRLLGESRVPQKWEQAEGLYLPQEVYEAVEQTRLGRFITGLFEIQNAKAVGFAIFDNGVERIIEETAPVCKSLILRSLLVPWDLGPNALFVWESSGSGKP